MAKSIDLNCDLGEGCGSDADLMQYITSANIACGFHAGDADTMKRTVDLALQNGANIGAHPGYRDRENFGRTSMSLSSKEIYEIVTEQIAALSKIATSAGAKLSHVKPHGALYNQAAVDAEIAATIAKAVFDIDPHLRLFGLSGSLSIGEADKLGLRTANEVFADRTYQTDGTLTPRTLPNALIEDAEQATTQALDMIKYGRVRSLDAIMIAIKADTICLHGDGASAVEFARSLRESLRASDIEVRCL